MKNTFEHSEQDQGPEHQPAADDHVHPMGGYRQRQLMRGIRGIRLHCDRLCRWFESCIVILQVNRRKNVRGAFALIT